MQRRLPVAHASLPAAKEVQQFMCCHALMAITENLTKIVLRHLSCGFAEL